MNINTEFVRGNPFEVTFTTRSNNMSYEFVTPQPFGIDFITGGTVDVVFARPNNRLEYEFSIGAQGPSGAEGTRGSLWFTGTSNPSNNFGDDFDIYLNYISYDLFQKGGGQWALIANIKGPVGPAGNGAGVLPVGGTTGQRLAKISNSDFDTAWVDAQNITYIHIQGTTATTWNINHSLNKFPSVTTVATNLNPFGIKVYGDIEYIDDNNITITFTDEIDGKAYLN